MPPDRKNGTSEPSVAATSVSCDGRTGSLHSLHQRRAAWPRRRRCRRPARPAAGCAWSTGSARRASGPVRRADRHSVSAARHTRFARSSGTPATSHSIANGPSRATHSMVSCSADRLEHGAQLVEAVGPVPSTRRSRLILACARTRTARLGLHRRRTLISKISGHILPVTNSRSPAAS